jgi:RNA binding activity-knot of a chromodomain
VLSQFRFAVILFVIVAVCGPARADEIAPAGSGVSIQKMVVQNGLAQTVKYFVTGGSPRLQALVRQIEWTENELNIVEQLQGLKMDTVVNERRVAAFNTNQLTNPYALPGFNPPPIPPGYGGAPASPLQRALGRELAAEATPAWAMQMIGALEQEQTQLDAELKALPPQEQKAAREPMDALRPRLAALPQSDVALPVSQPVVPGPALQAVPSAPALATAKAPVQVEWHGTWYPAQVLQVRGGLTQIHYTGYAASWDEWVPAGRIRTA